jgi:putative tricarboxylic transport membrane protein
MDSAMTMKEQGIDTSFVNWRGFFAAPGLPADEIGDVSRCNCQDV